MFTIPHIYRTHNKLPMGERRPTIAIKRGTLRKIKGTIALVIIGAAIGALLTFEYIQHKYILL